MIVKVTVAKIVFCNNIHVIVFLAMVQTGRIKRILNFCNMTIRDSNYITILAPMITRLKLKGNELLVFALIHGFSQDGESRFKGSLKYLIEWTGLDKTTVIKILKSLVEKQYINKFEYEKNKVRYCEYTTNYWAVLEWLENPTTPPVGKSNHPGCEIPPPPRLENPTL